MNTNSELEKIEEYSLNDKKYKIFFSGKEPLIFVYTSGANINDFYESKNPFNNKKLNEYFVDYYNWNDKHLVNKVIEILNKGFNFILLNIINRSSCVDKQNKLDLYYKILKNEEKIETRLFLIFLIHGYTFDPILYKELLQIEKNNKLLNPSKLYVDVTKWRVEGIKENNIFSKHKPLLDSIREPNEVFISYTGDIREWVEKLAKEMNDNNIKVYLDIWDVNFGERFTDFMNRIEEVNYILMIFTKQYITKLKAPKGGVSYERKIIESLIEKGLDHRIIPIIKEEDSKKLIPPRYSKKYCDLSSKKNYEKNVQSLIKQIKNPRS